MNRVELAEALAGNQNLSKNQALSIVNALFDGESGIIASTLKSGNDVSVQGFGTFKVVEKAARDARNPKTGETIKVAARKAAKFTAGKSLKGAVA